MHCRFRTLPIAVAKRRRDMMPRYKLRTLLILLAILPPLLAVGWWKYSDWRRRQAEERERQQVFSFYLGIMR
jgi:hypothetical protein